ncbi:MAG: DUF2130 domain-containing protein [Methanoregula sp.]|nr:MAG: DUF2130 domain-containing protein [Methanoregula sp.]
MKSEVIICPKCRTKIPLTEAITSQIREDLKKEFESELKEIKEKTEKDLIEEKEKIANEAKEMAELKVKIDLDDLRQQISEKDEKLQAAHKNELELRQRARELEAKEKEIDLEILKRVDESQTRIKEESIQKFQLELDDLRQQVSEKDEKINAALKKELEFRQKERKLDDRKKAIELEILKRIDEERNTIQNDAIKNFQEQFRLQLAERESKIQSLSSTVDELQRKIAQGSQQLQGEVLELELEDLLRDLFPSDVIKPIAKGARGADILQKIFHSGTYCGSIIWETKRAKAWHKDWITKLKSDQNDAKANTAVLYSTVFPKEMECSGQIDGVWVTDHSSMPGLATALRVALIEVARERIVSTGRNEKMELLNNYVNSPEFQQKVISIAESIKAMQDDLTKEKRAMEKIWAKREKQIQGVVLNTVRIVGDMHGIIGKSLEEIKVFELEEASESDE